MRLLNAHTGRLESFSSPLDVTYAALSHVWSEGEGSSYPSHEQTYHEVRFKIRSFGGLSQKIQNACKAAKKDGCGYIWIDTCCIDQTSSAEVSEAINSMYAWYSHSKVCYAYLADVDNTDNPGPEDSQFRKSKWFTRAWTLQELIAPRDVVFLSRDWKRIGCKVCLATIITGVTGIGTNTLNGGELSEVSVASRMSWAARRKATKEEDLAYCLIGIFGVHLRLNYGEGSHSFIRLQEAILKTIPDQTLFAWGPPPIRYRYTPNATLPATPQISREFSGGKSSCLFASSPNDFENASRFTVAPHMDQSCCNVKHPEFTPTAYGVRVSLPVFQYGECKLALLAAQTGNNERLALVLRPPAATREGGGYTGIDIAVGMTPPLNHPPAQENPPQYSRLVSFGHDFTWDPPLRIEEVYIRTNARAQRGHDPHDSRCRCTDPLDEHREPVPARRLRGAGRAISGALSEVLLLILVRLLLNPLKVAARVFPWLLWAPRPTSVDPPRRLEGASRLQADRHGAPPLNVRL